MKISELRTELRELIEKETDSKVLEAIKILLEKSRQDPELKKKLTSRALKAEDDISSGRVLSREELESKLQKRMGV